MYKVASQTNFSTFLLHSINLFPTAYRPGLQDMLGLSASIFCSTSGLALLAALGEVANAEESFNYLSNVLG